MISVIIPSYNRENTIKRSIDSVLDQTYKDIEIVVVDDCSSDNTQHIVSMIGDKRIKYVRLDKNSGACIARNKGIELAKGEYIAFQDSDDEWVSNKLELQLSAINLHKADICISSMNRYGHKRKMEVFPVLIDGIIDYSELMKNYLVSTQTILAKRKVFEIYKFDPQIRRMQDFDWAIRAVERYTLCSISEPLVNVYLQKDSITDNDHVKLIDVYMVFIDKYSMKMKKYPDLYELLYKQLETQKSLIGENTSELLRELYEHTGKKKYIIKLLLNKMGLL